MNESFDDYVHRKLIEALEPWRHDCGRCDVSMWMIDGRCAICGMDPRDEGPVAPLRNVRGVQPQI